LQRLQCGQRLKVLSLGGADEEVNSPDHQLTGRKVFIRWSITRSASTDARSLN
jgi:hypothetical protein